LLSRPNFRAASTLQQRRPSRRLLLKKGPRHSRAISCRKTWLERSCSWAILDALLKKFAADAKTQAQQAPNEAVAGSLTTGKLNAVRAAFKAGLRPSAIARQFGISQSDVRKRSHLQVSK
jgi:hypothetical protein